MSKDRIWRVVALMLPRDQRGMNGRPTHDDELAREVPGEYDSLTEQQARDTYSELCRSLRYSRAEYRVTLYRGDVVEAETKTTYRIDDASRQICEYLETVRSLAAAGQQSPFLEADRLFSAEVRSAAHRMVLDEARARREPHQMPTLIRDRLAELIGSAMRRLQGAS